jgi:hypothetical protein
MSPRRGPRDPSHFRKEAKPGDSDMGHGCVGLDQNFDAAALADGGEVRAVGANRRMHTRDWLAPLSALVCERQREPVADRKGDVANSPLSAAPKIRPTLSLSAKAER